MTTIIFEFLVFYALLFIARNKFKLQYKMQISRYKLFYSLGACDFCFAFWVAVFTVISISTICGFGWADILRPFCIMGIWLILIEAKDV